MRIWNRKGLMFQAQDFETEAQFIHFVKCINICDLLGLGKYSNCIFHDDHTQSASIFRAKETGEYLYTCHSSNCCLDAGKSFTGDIFKLLMMITGCDFRHTIEFFKLVLNSSIETRRDMVNSSHNRDLNIGYIEGNESIIRDKGKTLCPKAMKIAGKSLRVLCTLYSIAKTNQYASVNSRQEICFSESATHLRTEMEKLYDGCGNIKTSQELAILAYLGLIRKIAYDEIDDDWQVQSAINMALNSDSGVKLINQLCIIKLTPEKLKAIEDRAEQWNKYHYQKKTFSFEEIEKNEGIFAAMKIYPQGCKVKVNDKPKQRQTKSDFILE